MWESIVTAGRSQHVVAHSADERRRVHRSPRRRHVLEGHQSCRQDGLCQRLNRPSLRHHSSFSATSAIVMSRCCMDRVAGAQDAGLSHHPASLGSPVLDLRDYLLAAVAFSTEVIHHHPRRPASSLALCSCPLPSCAELRRHPSMSLIVINWLVKCCIGVTATARTTTSPGDVARAASAFTPATRGRHHRAVRSSCSGYSNPRFARVRARRGPRMSCAKWKNGFCNGASSASESSACGRHVQAQPHRRHPGSSPCPAELCRQIPLAQHHRPAHSEPSLPCRWHPRRRTTQFGTAASW